MNAYLCPARGASPRRVYWERRLPRVYEKSARPALPGLFTDPGRRSRCIMAFLALLMCLGVWLAPAGHIADAAGLAAMPPTTSGFRLPTSDFRLLGSSDDTARVAVRGRSTDRRRRGSYPAGVAGREPTARSGRRSTTDGA